MTSTTQSAANLGLCERNCGQGPDPLRSARRPFLNPLHFLLQFCHTAAAIFLRHSCFCVSGDPIRARSAPRDPANRLPSFPWAASFISASCTTACSLAALLGLSQCRCDTKLENKRSCAQKMPYTATVDILYSALRGSEGDAVDLSTAAMNETSLDKND